MLYAAMKTGRWVILAGGLLLIATPSQAGISVELAKKCRAMAIEAHPTQLYGMNGSATPQREYYNACVARDGKMQDQTTGSGTQSGK